MKNLELRRVASKLQEELDAAKATDVVIDEAAKILRPLIDLVLCDRLNQLPAELPRRGAFFFCMHDHCLAGRHLIGAADLLNAIGEFGDALRKYSSENSATE